jgi:hypothetical protein
MNGNERAILSKGAPLDVVEQEYEKLTEEELIGLNTVLGAFRTFRGDRRKHIAYVSMPITTGKRYYEVLADNKVNNPKELMEKKGPDALWKLVMQPNIKKGIAFADRLGTKRDLLFIAPSVFEAKKWRWTQEAYMSLWYRVIAEMAGCLFMMDGWEYSTGGVKEFLFSMILQWKSIRWHNVGEIARNNGWKNFFPDMSYERKKAELKAMWNIRVFSARGNEIDLYNGLAKIVWAISELKSARFDYKPLAEVAECFTNFLLATTPSMSDAFGCDGFLEIRESLSSLCYA